MLKVFDINKSTNGGKNPLLDACPNFQRYIVTTPLTLLDIPQLTQKVVPENIQETQRRNLWLWEERGS